MFSDLAFGWCVWDLPALGVLLAVAAAFAVHHLRLRRQERRLRDELTSRMAGEMMDHL